MKKIDINFRYIRYLQKNIFKLKTLKSKFLASMLIVTFVSIVIQTITSMKTSMNIVEKNYIDSHISSLITSGKNLDLLLTPIVSVNRMVLSDRTLLDMLNQISLKNMISSYDLRNIERSFSTTISQNQYIDAMYFISDTECMASREAEQNDQPGCMASSGAERNDQPGRMASNGVERNDQPGDIFYYAKNNSISQMVDKINVEELKKERWYSETIEADGKEMFYCGDVFGKNDGTQKYFTVTKLIKDVNNKYRNYGIIVMSLRSSIIKNIFPSTSIYSKEEYIIFDKKTGWHYSDNNSAELLNVVKQNSKEHEAGNIYRNTKYIMSMVRNDTTDWELFNVIERGVLEKRSRQIAVNSILLASLMLLIIIILLIFISNAINKPIKKIKKLIEDFASGSRNITEEFDDSEIGCIGNQFKFLVNNNIELNERLMMSRIKQREAEIIALQEQINPHFLYNTLDLLYWMAAMNEQQEIAEMVVSLSNIFKLTLNNGEMLIKVSKELEHIQNYLKIQKMRYRDRLKTYIEFDDDILQLEILNLILQPFVENAIYHGIEPVVCGGSVWVTGKKLEEKLIFTIKDNGIGMDVGSINKGYAISNVRERIELFYGQDSELKIESEKGKGTRVTIIVRIIKVKDTMGGRKCIRPL